MRSIVNLDRGKASFLRLGIRIFRLRFYLRIRSKWVMEGSKLGGWPVKRVIYDFGVK